MLHLKVGPPCFLESEYVDLERAGLSEPRCCDDCQCLMCIANRKIPFSYIKIFFMGFLFFPFLLFLVVLAAVSIPCSADAGLTAKMEDIEAVYECHWQNRKEVQKWGSRAICALAIEAVFIIFTYLEFKDLSE